MGHIWKNNLPFKHIRKKRAKCPWEGGLSLIYAFLTKPNAKNRPNVYLGGRLLWIYVFLTNPNVPKIAQNGSFPKNIKPVTLPIREPRSRHYLNTYCKSRFSQFLRQTYLQRDFETPQNQCPDAKNLSNPGLP